MSSAFNNSRGSLRFSFFQGGIYDVEPTHTFNLGYTHKFIQGRPLRRLTEELRALPLGSKVWQLKKLQLPNVTPAGVFTQRAAANLAERSGLLVLDFDHVPDLAKLKNALRHDPIFGASLALYFVSPSGDGLKVFVVVSCEVPHATSFEVIKAYLQAQQPHWFKYLDSVTGDIARACFLVHDPKAFLHLNWDLLPPFPVDTAAGMATLHTTPSTPVDGDNEAEDAVTAERWVQGVEAAGGFPDDYDTWYKSAFSLASLGETGRVFFHRVSKLSRKYSPTKCDKQFDAVLRAPRNRFSIGTFIHHCQQAGITPAAILPDLVAMPLFEASIYPLLPDYLRRCCAPFEGIEGDVMLLGTLAVLSGCFPGVGGVYNRRTCNLNLFVFIAGPAASGKGALAWARHLVEPWDEQLLEASIQYYEQLTAYEKAAAPTLPPPIAPPYHQLLVPGNITAAALIACLAANRGRGVICETEADTLSGQLGSDFGNFSDILRKAFHGEPVSVMRKTNREHLRVKRPALSVALTGTADQLLRLLPSAEDGLVSRILFKVINPDYEWKDVGPGSGSALDPYMDKLAEELSSMLATMPILPTAGEYSTQITLAATDWQRLNEACKEGLDEALAAHGGQGASTAYRLGLIVWRIVGILTVLRCFERGVTPGAVVEAEAVDVTIALILMQTARTHAMTVLANLAKPMKFTTNQQGSKAAKVAEATTLRASGLSWRQIEQKVGVPFNTIRRWLKATD
jgi:hypothetical protein